MLHVSSRSDNEALCSVAAAPQADQWSGLSIVGLNRSPGLKGGTRCALKIVKYVTCECCSRTRAVCLNRRLDFAQFLPNQLLCSSSSTRISGTMKFIVIWNRRDVNWLPQMAQPPFSTQTMMSYIGALISVNNTLIKLGHKPAFVNLSQ